MKNVHKIIFFLLLSSISVFGQDDISTSWSDEDTSGKPQWIEANKVANYNSAPYAIEDGKKQYVAQANIKSGLFVGKWRTDWDAASIPWGYQELWTKNFKVISAGIWKKLTSTHYASSGIKLPPRSLQCGKDANNKVIYAARITTKKYGQQIGKYSPWIKMLSFCYGGKEIELPVSQRGAYISNEKAVVEILTNYQRID
jgi:hypothetical protein